MDVHAANDDDAEPARWRPFFRIAGSGYGVDDASSPEWRQLNHGWQKEWTIEDDPQRAHERSKNPVCVYDLSHAERNCADLAARCELATGGRVIRTRAPEGVDFAFVTFEREEHARALCETGLTFEGSEATHFVEAVRLPGPALVRWRREMRERVGSAE